jgi:hypothetical protein
LLPPIAYHLLFEGGGQITALVRRNGHDIGYGERRTRTARKTNGSFECRVNGGCCIDVNKNAFERFHDRPPALTSLAEPNEGRVG